MSSSEGYYTESDGSEEIQEHGVNPIPESPNWVRGDFLGKGGFARVYSMQNTKTGEFFAGKFSGVELPETGKRLEGAAILKRMKKAREMLKKEIAVHRLVRHPNIVSYISSFATNSCYEEKDILVEPDDMGECDVLVLEICPNKSLFELLKTRKKLTEDEARFYTFHIATALAYLHDMGIMHRDIKLGNIFLDAKLNPKIGDFGLAIKSSSSDEFVGTPNYVAPEILKRQEYSFPVDTWSLGVCLYTLIRGKPPFETHSVDTTYSRIKSGTYIFPDGVFSANAKNIIRQILATDPKERISMRELLKQPFFTEEQIPEAMPIEARVKIPESKSIRRRFVSAVYDNLVAVLDEKQSLTSGSPRGPAPEPLVWIQHWKNYSKYGLVYQDNIGSPGAYFNDNTVMAIDSDGTSVKYVDTKKGGTVDSFSVDIYPEYAKKKVLLLQHLVKKMSTWQTILTIQQKSLSKLESLGTKVSNSFVYVTKWLQTPVAFFFRFSNNMLQVNFNDNTGIILSSEGTIVTHIDRDQMSTFWLSEVWSRKSILPRLYYIRDMLKTLVEKESEKI